MPTGAQRVSGSDRPASVISVLMSSLTPTTAVSIYLLPVGQEKDQDRKLVKELATYYKMFYEQCLVERDEN